MASQTSPSFVGKVWTKGELDKRSKNNGNQSLYRTNGEKLLTYFEIFHWSYAFRSILDAFRCLHPKVTENRQLN